MTTAMLLTICAWLVLWALFVGAGLFIRRCIGLNTRDAQSLFACFWIGFAFLISFSQIWHLFFSIDWRVSVITSAVSLAGICWNWNDVKRLIKTHLAHRWGFSVIVAIIGLWVAHRANLPLVNYDTGLYYLQSIRWANEYPIVPGLGNLHGRLAFNNSYFLYVAALEIGPWLTRSQHLTNGLLLWAISAQLVWSSFKILDPNRPSLLYHIFNAVCLVPVLKLGLSSNVSSPSPDLTVFVLGVVLSAQSLLLLLTLHNTKEAKDILFRICVYAFLGVTIKLSFVSFAAGTILVSYTAYFFKGDFESYVDYGKTLALAVACMTVTVVPWMVRGVILSGYLFYPATIASLPVEWRVPRESATLQSNWIRSWARRPHTPPQQILGNWSWFRLWLSNQVRNRDVTTPLLLTLVGMFCILVAWFRHHCDRETLSRFCLILLPPFGSLIFWFISAPDPRFAGAAFWATAAGTFAIGIETLRLRRNVPTLFTIVYLAITLSTISPIDARALVQPEMPGGSPQIPKADVTNFSTRSKLLLYVPKMGNQCWAAPLPCTPFPNAGLRLRRENDLSSGFVVEPTHDPIGMHS